MKKIITALMLFLAVTVTQAQESIYDFKVNIRWNFTKFLISADGKILKRFEPGDKMEDVETAVAQALEAKKSE